MGLFIKLMLFVVVVAVAALFFLKDPDGEPLMTVSDLKEPEKVSGIIERLPEVKNPFSEQAEEKSPEKLKPPEKTKIYSWRDEQGNIHFTDQPPEGKQDIKTIKVDPNRNVLPATKPPNHPELGKEISEKLSELQLPEMNVQENADQMMRDKRESKDNMLQRKDSYDRVIDQ